MAQSIQSLFSNRRQKSKRGLQAHKRHRKGVKMLEKLLLTAISIISAQLGQEVTLDTSVSPTRSTLPDSSGNISHRGLEVLATKGLASTRLIKTGLCGFEINNILYSTYRRIKVVIACQQKQSHTKLRNYN
ncbi:hypothetical protein RF11_15745 [Thelohanellus kitauei]|uniref:Uncharacterized protein n=1 Tax=Thelohanellus kitauei TaxID=669202 RepID=A0A0C2M013_THEKT|nr:hypothetical protein RF11_15745 [Thelohanellus kitauei]